MKLLIALGASLLTAELEDSAAARDFAALLPLTLMLEDFAAAEKISDLPKRLSLDGAPSGTSASVGDITYYAPWGNLALFYRKGSYAAGLVRLGVITSGIEHLQRPGSLKATISLAKEKE